MEALGPGHAIEEERSLQGVGDLVFESAVGVEAVLDPRLRGQARWVARDDRRPEVVGQRRDGEDVFVIGGNADRDPGVRNVEVVGNRQFVPTFETRRVTAQGGPRPLAGRRLQYRAERRDGGHHRLGVVGNGDRVRR
jgi:hypothetical protein